ncbi:MAG TPA: hypothetical protein VKA01_13005 [Vicinamibacteria bacterium]|nr:hypothetical protein [Vicinamibacteria bacterium]
MKRGLSVLLLTGLLDCSIGGVDFTQPTAALGLTGNYQLSVVWRRAGTSRSPGSSGASWARKQRGKIVRQGTHDEMKDVDGPHRDLIAHG